MQINIYKKVETRAHARRDFIFPFVPNVLFDEIEVCTAKKLTQRGTNITAWLKNNLYSKGSWFLHCCGNMKYNILYILNVLL